MSEQNPTAVQRPGCRWCGMMHGPQCPSVRAIDFGSDGVTVKRVEFHAPQPVQLSPWPHPWQPQPPVVFTSLPGHST